MNYAEVRRKVEYAFAEKANELHDWLALVQSLSKESLQILEKLDTHCGVALRHAEDELGHVGPSARQAPNSLFVARLLYTFFIGTGRLIWRSASPSVAAQVQPRYLSRALINMLYCIRIGGMYLLCGCVVPRTAGYSLRVCVRSAAGIPWFVLLVKGL